MSPVSWASLFLLFHIGILVSGRSSSGKFCSGRQGGLYADSSDCRKYIQCASGFEYRGMCPRRTLFSDTLGVCDWANQVNCEQVPGGYHFSAPVGKRRDYTTDTTIPAEKIKASRSTQGKCCACIAEGSENTADTVSDEMDDAPAKSGTASGDLTAQDVAAIEKSFGLVAASASAKDIGVGFFRLLFTTYPEWKTKYFHHFGDEPLEEFLKLPRFRVHAGGVIGKLGHWVSSLGDIEMLTESIKQNARNHKARGIGTEQYRTIAGVLLSYLAAGLGDKLTPAMATGWTKLLDTMVDIVSAELDPISTTDVRNIEKSFTLVANSASLTDLGVGFFRLLFTTYPEWKAKYFHHFGDEPLEEFLELPRFRAHAGGVIGKLGHWVSSLDDIEMLAESIKQNARNHKARGIGSEQYRTIAGVLLSYLADSLGDSFTAEMATAWTKMLDTMVEVVQQELKSNRGY